MIPALTRILPRASCRCFASRAAVLNVRPPVKASYPRPATPYTSLPIVAEQPERDPARSWDNTMGQAIGMGDNRTPAEKWRDNSLNTVPQLQRHQPADPYHGWSASIALNASLNLFSGRSVKVKGGNFGEALRELDKILAHNRVKATLRLTERHEKKGVKRRRIKSQQWRKHFANQVRACI